jgi:tryptophan-rich sensory protein
VNIKSLTLAGLICAVSIVGEAILAGKDSNAILRSLKQPTWALPAWAWYLVGLAYYGACFLCLYRLSDAPPSTRMRFLGLTLTIVMMSGNVAWNFIFFRRRDLELSFWFFLPYSILILVLLYALSQIDRVSAEIFLIYFLYLPYALAWSYRTWKLNGNTKPASAA